MKPFERFTKEQNRDKVCLTCNLPFPRKKGISNRFWLRQTFCSSLCRYKGYKHTEERKIKIGKAGTGRHPSKETKLKTSGESNYRWIVDRTKLKKYDGSEEKRSPAYKAWRKSVCDRDNWSCRIADNNCDGKLEVHHILRWSDFPELRYQINNGITLCHAHHPLARAEEKRLVPTFQELVSVLKVQNR